MGSNPGAVYWMDIFSHTFVVKICNVCLKRPKINEKEAGVGPFFKKRLIGLSLTKTLLGLEPSALVVMKGDSCLVVGIPCDLFSPSYLASY